MTKIGGEMLALFLVFLLEVVRYYLRALFAHNIAQLLRRGLCDSLDALKVCEQSICALLSDALDFAYLAIEKVEATLLAMEGDAEAVCLVADMADHL